MAVDAVFYDHFAKITKDGEVDLDTDVVKCALVTSSYTPATTHTIWANVSTNEVASGAGYTTGGETVANITVTNTALDGDDVTWTALTKTFRYAVFYVEGTFDSLVNPLLFYYLLNDAPADTVITAANFTIQFDATGIMTFTLTDAT
jgi:hypothetical protein